MNISNVFDRKGQQKPPVPQIILRLLNALLLILVIIYFAYKIPKIDLKSIIENLKTTKIIVPYFIITCSLLFLNYFFEIKKWQLLVKATEHRTYLQASKDVLLGSAAGLITPFMLGDFMGRTYSFSKKNTAQALVLNAFNSFTQTWVAMVLGLISLILLVINRKQIYVSNGTLLGFSIFCFVCLVLLLNTKIKQKLGSILPTNIQTLLLVQIDIKVKLLVVLFTFCRNLVFVVQYAFLFAALGITLDFQTIFIGINLVLLAKTVGFGINVLGELSMRSILSVQFFENYGVSSIHILCITFIIWLLNVILPAFIGAAIPIFSKKS